MDEKTGYVYILASKRNGTLYIGVTSDLVKRVYEHKRDLIDGFTKRYGVHQLVYFENGGDMEGGDCTRETIEKMESQMEVGFD